jgi:hypothetical protein
MGVVVVRCMPFRIKRFALERTRPHTQLDQRFVNHPTSPSDLFDPGVGWQLPPGVIGIGLWGGRRRRVQVIAQFEQPERFFHARICPVYVMGGRGPRVAIFAAWLLRNTGVSDGLAHSIASHLK